MNDVITLIAIKKKIEWCHLTTQNKYAMKSHNSLTDSYAKVNQLLSAIKDLWKKLSSSLILVFET